MNCDTQDMADAKVRRKEILKARAVDLARPRREEAREGEWIEVVEFRLACERYAIEQCFVREVVPLRHLTSLPGAPTFVAGIVNVRSQIVSVVDLKKFFELPDPGITDLHVVVILRQEDIEVGILADAASGMRSILVDKIQPALPTLTGIRSAFVKGLTSDGVVILDGNSILSESRLIVDDESLK